MIESLAAEGAGRRGAGVVLRFGLTLAAAALLCAALLLVLFTAPPASTAGNNVIAFALKTGFTSAVAIGAALALFAAGHPGRRPFAPLLLSAAGIAVVVALAATELLSGAAIWPGATWAVCLASIALLTPLGFAAAVVAMRRLAPVHLHLAGALCGLFAAGTSSAAYALWCPETTALFLLSWYVGPIALFTAIGALAGPRLLRW